MFVVRSLVFLIALEKLTIQGPVVRSVVSLTSSLVVKILTALVSTIFNSQVFLLKNVLTFGQQKY